MAPAPVTTIPCNELPEIKLPAPAPQVYSCKVGTLDEPFSYLMMEFLDGVDLAEARNRCGPEQYDHVQVHLADLLLRRLRLGLLVPGGGEA